MSVPPPLAPAPDVPDAPEPVPDPVGTAGLPAWSPLAALVVAYAAAIVFVAILAGVAGQTDGDLSSGVTLGATFVQDLLLIVAMVGFARMSGVRVTPGLFGLRRVPWRAFGLAALAFVVFYGFLLAWSQLDTSAKDDLAAELGAKDSTAALIAVAVLVGVVAPIVEETFFRGFLFGAMRNAFHWVVAAGISGAIFGLVHAGGTPVIFLVPLMVLGFLLCLLYRRTGSLLPGMGVHAFNNALALGVSLDWTAPQVLAAVIAAPVIVITLAASVSE
jgi:membrane protease YdiL (CAAX protease family)